MSAKSDSDASQFRDFIHGLRGALPYLEEFHNETFVVKISGNTLRQKNLSGIMDDMILLYRIGIKIIIVHGANAQIGEILQIHGHNEKIVEGRIRVPLESLPIVQQAIASANWKLITKLSRYGRDIFPYSGHFVRAEKVSFSQDSASHCTGKVQDIHVKSLQEAFAHHYLPIIAPFAIAENGRLLILEANQIALEVAARLRARKLIILEHRDNFPFEEIYTLRETKPEAMRQWLRQATFLTCEPRLQLQALIEACERGVERCHWLDSTIDGAILGEILTSTGTGIMLTNSAYEHIRFAKLPDIHHIQQILEKPVNELVLVHKSSTYLEQHIENFLVFCIDESLIGCCELIFYEENKSMEIASLAVKQEYRNRGIGKQLIVAAQEQAALDKQTLIFALTTKSSHIFTANGFKETNPSQLPQQKRKNYDFEESLIYGKIIS